MSGNGYEFSLAFAVAGSLGRETWIEGQLERCCGDASASRSGAGLITLRFLREADSAHEAIVTAVAEVRRAVPLASLVEAGPDFVGLSDIAALFAVTRQTMRKLLVGGLRPAPLPVHEGQLSIWRLALVLGWLRDEKHYPVDDALDEVAWAAMQTNEALTARFADPVAQAEVAAVLDLPKLAPLNPWQVTGAWPLPGVKSIAGEGRAAAGATVEFGQTAGATVEFGQTAGATVEVGQTAGEMTAGRGLASAGTAAADGAADGERR